MPRSTGRPARPATRCCGVGQVHGSCGRPRGRARSTGPWWTEKAGGACAWWRRGPRRRRHGRSAPARRGSAAVHGRSCRGHHHARPGKASAMHSSTGIGSDRECRCAWRGGSAAAVEPRRARSRGSEADGGRERHRCDPQLLRSSGKCSRCADEAAGKTSFGGFQARGATIAAAWLGHG